MPSIQSPVSLTHLGAKNCVTGSCHLMQTAVGVNILVDCGKAYGRDAEMPFDQFHVQPGDIDYLFLTHAHIDHIGRVPDLIDAGFRGEIICTHATKALLMPMLHDAMSFSDRNEKEVSRMEALIDELSWGFELHESFSLSRGITFKMGNAGHILGSCFIRFQIPMEEILANRLPGDAPVAKNAAPSGVNDFSIIFSGDLGCTDTPILPDPDAPDTCDLLVLESTYGDRNHEGREERVDALRRLLHNVGTVLNLIMCDRHEDVGFSSLAFLPDQIF